MLYALIRPLLFCCEPERAHQLTFNLLKYLYPQWAQHYYLNTLPAKPVIVNGLSFKNPIGLAAGLDKNGDYINQLVGLGFGFIELGTVTPKPQGGNPKPRLFRIPQAQALVNRMGFNNLGVDHLVNRLQAYRQHLSNDAYAPAHAHVHDNLVHNSDVQANSNVKVNSPVIIGANIGKNKSTPIEQAADDYAVCFEKVYPYVDYVTINISSPNTPGLRRLQSNELLHDLLSRLIRIRQHLMTRDQRQVPLWVKIAPDLSEPELTDLTSLLLRFKIDAIIVSNTTIDHHAVLNFPNGGEEGGVSGLPLFDASTKLVYRLNQLLQGQIPIVAVGGIMTVEHALAKLAAGASLIQLYSGLIYEGPGLIKKILSALNN